jgi:superoxide dismutase, Fe-Mn family
MAYTPQSFSFGALEGISQKQLDVHLKLYEGYVKFINTLDDVLADLMKDSEKNAYALGEVNRRRGFEFDGMRMHEGYFSQWEGAATPINGSLKDALARQYGSYEAWEAQFRAVGMTRGIGWAVLYYDPIGKRFHNAFLGDHEVGQLTGLPVILAMDMWEHAYMVDYLPAEKAKYIDAFFKNLNGTIIDERFQK